MAENVIGAATIKVTAETSGFQKGVQDAENSLNKFKQTSTRSSQEIQKELDSLSQSMGTVTTSTDNLTKKDQKFVDSKKRQVVALTDSKSALIEYDVQQKVSQKEQAAVTAALEPYIQKLRQQEALLRELQDPGRKYIEMLKSESATIGMTRKEAMMYQAAQLGVLEQATPLINAQFDTSRAFTAVEMSAKQTRQAMRLLPAQITDVVTSLASGMPMYLVAIQQGGQLRDSFGGFGNVLKGVVSLINPTAIAVAALAAVGGTAAYAYFQMSEVMYSFNRTLIETGNFSGMTSSAMAEMARNVAANIGSYRGASEAINLVVSSQALLGQSYQAITQASVMWSKATGASVEDVVKKFITIGEDPAKAMMKLTSEMNFLTVAQYDQVQALLEQGNQSEASRLLVEALANTMNDRAPQMIEQTNIFARAWMGVKDAVSDAITAIGNALTGPTLQENFDQTLKKYFELMETRDKYLNDAGTLAAIDQEIESTKNLLAVLNERIVTEQKKADTDKFNNEQIQLKNKLTQFLTEGMTEEEKVYQKLNAVVEQYVRLLQIENMTAAQKLALDSALTEQVNSIWEAYLKKADAVPKATKAVKDVNEEIRKSIANYEFETEAMLMNTYEREKAKFIRDMESKGIEENSQAWRDNLDAFTEAQFARMTQQGTIDFLKREKKEYEDMVKARLKEEENFARQMDQINNQIGQSLSDAIMNGGKNAKEMLINLFKTLVLRPLLQPIIAGVTGMFAPALASAMGVPGADGSVGGGTSSLSMASSLKSAYDMFSGGFASAGAVFTDLGVSMGSQFIADFGYGFGAGFTTGSGVTANAGAMLGAAANAAAGIAAGIGIGELISGGKSAIGGNSLFATGGGTAIGAAIGSIVPGIGTAIGAAVGGIIGGVVNAAFGSGAKEYTDAGISGTLKAMGADLQEYQKWKKAGGWFTSTKRGTEFNEINAELKQGIDGALAGISTSVAVMAASLGQPLDAINTFSQEIKLSFKDMSNEQIAQEIEKSLKLFETSLVDALIPNITEFARVGEKTAAEVLVRLSSELNSVNNVFDVLGYTLYETSLQGADAASKLVELFGGLQNFTTATNFFYENFYTQQEKVSFQTEQLTKIFEAMNLTLPTTHTQFRSMVEAAKAAGDEQLFATLVQLAPAFNTLQVGLEQLGQSAKSASSALQQRITLENKLLQLTNSNSIIRAREISDIDESNIGIANAIYAIEDAQAAVDAAMNALAISVEAERTQALNALETQHDILMKSLEDQKKAAELAKDVANESVSGLRSIFNFIGSQVEQINRDVDASRMAAAGMQFISQALINAQRTGYLPNQEELSSAVSAARGGLSAQNFATSFEMRRANLQLASKLTLLGELTGDQLSVAEKQLIASELSIEKLDEQILQTREMYDAEVDRTNTYYDQILADAEAQINALNGINGGVLSVQQAVIAVQAAIAQLAAAQATGRQMVGGFSGGGGGGGGGLNREQQIAGLYQSILERAPDPEGLQYWINTNDNIAKIAQDIELSVENRAQEISRFYEDILGRAPDVEGLQYWVNSADNLNKVAELIAQSPEAQTLRGFASGGYYSGGMAMVGEQGPELINFNQPGMIYSNSQLRSAMSGEDTAAEIRALRQENQAQSRAMVALQSRMTKIIEQWDGDGLPEARYEGATA